MKAQSTRRPIDTRCTIRRLSVEVLEERRLLHADSGVVAAAPAPEDVPWQNPAYRLDVDNSGATTGADVLAIVSRMFSDGIGALPPPDPNPPLFYYDTSGDNRLTGEDVLAVVNALFAPPQVAVNPLVTQTADLTPLVRVSVTDTPQVPDGTAFDLDVDLNGDGDFDDDGELAYMQPSLLAGSATFEIEPALVDMPEVYSIHLRARVTDADGVRAMSSVVPLGVDLATSEVLEEYVASTGPAEYELATGQGVTNPIPGVTVAGSYFYYLLDMTSHTWRSTDDVDLPEWRHYIEVYVPVEPSGDVIADLDDTAILVIGGGSYADGVPQSPDPALALGATGLRTILANVTGVPSQPLTFADETIPRSGNAIAAYTFDQFMDHLGETDNETWPVLLPMVASAVRAMDVVQDFVPTLEADAGVDEFLVTGYSIRGWATWLVAAIDERVQAIIPGVFDNLNLPQQMAHHFGVYGFFSEAIDDYQDLQVFDRILTEGGVELSRIVDPYRYLNNGRFDDLPKLLVNSPGDEFFPADSARHYIDDIPGDRTYLRYIPNTSHSLQFAEDEVAESTFAFFDAVLHDRPLPQFSWTVDADETIRVTAQTAPSQVRMWQMNNVNARDFRRLRYPGIFWFSTPLADQGGGTYVTNVAMPASGARAYFVELTFPNPVPGLPDFVFTTEVRVKTALPFHAWPFEAGSPAAQPGAAAVTSGEADHRDEGRARAAVAVAVGGDRPPPPAETRGWGLPRPGRTSEGTASSIAAGSPALLMEAPEVPRGTDRDLETIDYVFGAGLGELVGEFA